MAVYTYSIANDTAEGVVDYGRLLDEILAEAPTIPNPSDVSGEGDDLRITFGSELDSEEEDALDVVVSNHTGAAQTVANFCACSKIVDDELAITEDDTWQELGGFVTTIGFFISDASKAQGRVVGSYKTDGDGAELRLVNSSGSLMTTAFDCGDTSSAWATMQFSTDVDPVLTIDTYILEGRLNGATSASVRFTSASLLEIES
jgi:hypothetical protein